MNWKQFVTDYLIFSKKERIGIIAIVILILIIIFVPDFIHRSNPKLSAADSTWLNSIKSLEVNNNDSDTFDKSNDDETYSHRYDHSETENKTSTAVSLFYFDPNTLDIKGWEKLGVREKTIHTIQNYLNKGGHFKKPEDLQKIYGLDKNTYEKLAPFIRIASTNEEEKPKESGNVSEETNQQSKLFIKHYSTIEINTADTTAFISLSGIGSKLASRIVNFREKLGGFYSVQQVGEIFGLPDSTFQKIKEYLKITNTSLRKININTATVDELKTHPYIRWAIANTIIAYRNEHGPFKNLEDIKKIQAITDDLYNKIAPYLSLQ